MRKDRSRTVGKTAKIARGGPFDAQWRVVAHVEGSGTLQQEDRRQAGHGHPTVVAGLVEKRTQHRCDAAPFFRTVEASATFAPWCWSSACVARFGHGRESNDVANYDALRRVFASRVEFRTIASNHHVTFRDPPGSILDPI